MKRIAKVLDIDGEYRDAPDSPIAVVRESQASNDDGVYVEGMIVDPIFNYQVTSNLFGRIMTLVEATCETHKLKSVKDLFGRELRDWEDYVYKSAREIAESGNRDHTVPQNSNIYLR